MSHAQTEHFIPQVHVVAELMLELDQIERRMKSVSLSLYQLGPKEGARKKALLELLEELKSRKARLLSLKHYLTHLAADAHDTSRHKNNNAIVSNTITMAMFAAGALAALSKPNSATPQ